MKPEFMIFSKEDIEDIKNLFSVNEPLYFIIEACAQTYLLKYGRILTHEELVQISQIVYPDMMPARIDHLLDTKFKPKLKDFYKRRFNIDWNIGI